MGVCTLGSICLVHQQAALPATQPVMLHIHFPAVHEWAAWLPKCCHVRPAALPPQLMVCPQTIICLRCCRARTGGTATRLIWASLHTGVHLLTALLLMVLLELGVETCIRQVGP